MSSLRELIRDEILKTPDDKNAEIWISIQHHEESKLWRVAVIFAGSCQTVVSPQAYADEQEARNLSEKVRNLISEESARLGRGEVRFDKKPNRVTH